jgi:lysosomal Pro-X carboxypeptidase
MGVYYNYTGDNTCYNTSSQSTNALGTSAWEYQTCTEMVMPMGTNGTSDMFPPAFWDEDAWVSYCKQTWGVTPRKDW